MGRTSIVQQIEMSKHLGRRRILWQWETTTATGQPEKTGNLFTIEILNRCIAAGRGIERTKADQLPLFEHPNQTGINPGNQLFRGIEAAADQFGTGLTDQTGHNFGCRSSSPAPFT